MKRNWFALLGVALALLLALPTALATGDPNLDGGGGGMGDALDAQNKWSPGDDGVRVTVVTQNGGLAAEPIDLSNKARSVDRCWTKHSKLQYLTGASLSRKDEYTNWEMPEDLSLPTIIQSGGGSNILAIKSYFTDERVIAYIAGKVGMELSTLTGGEYKLLLEPIAYFTYQGVRYAMTATEAAMFDAEYAGGDLRYQLGRCTHQNLPLSMYLEQSDFGIYPWTGGKYKILRKKVAKAASVDYTIHGTPVAVVPENRGGSHAERELPAAHRKIPPLHPTDAAAR